MIKFREVKYFFLLENITLSAIFQHLSLILWGLSSVGRASDLHSEGQEFDSPSLHNLFPAVIAQLVRALH